MTEILLEEYLESRHSISLFDVMKVSAVESQHEAKALLYNFAKDKEAQIKRVFMMHASKDNEI